ncbi:ABC transporter substrate-binding protein [Psychrobacillus lasiicapitis]|uniref:Iron ABC transporter substrate-binding protein n=1 Tax=Psychrobacillus lasiicapitis TaxID=1636719 RepID=A0A544T4T6_9BACI|nr:helical backbone metal receptor [Psychrobacillus lasiicapitis]TQR12439.1 iron ABC transporter substrate-binding protein [Psychrobacillus lasiicapitis]GGA38119.1 iron ABC transporter [Psychrobacillus lasiicapitis]
MTRIFNDHTGRQVNIPATPKRIISICPAITETLFTLGLQDEIVGRTKYCIFPEDIVESVEKIGGTKEVKEDKIRALQPDLILAEKEENTAEIVQVLEKIAPVYVLEVQSIQDSYRFIKTLGTLTNKESEANLLVDSCKTVFPSSRMQVKNAAYVIWRKPYMVVGGTTYINDVLHTLGFHNPFANEGSRYPAVTPEDLSAANLDVLLLASEPFPYQEKHIAEFRAFLPNTKIILIEGEMFWYGARMEVAGAYLEKLASRID